MMELIGKCHCGAVSVVLKTDQAPGEFTVRTCQCSFCRKHGARAVADPGGSLTVSLASEDAATRYRFDPRTADFILCSTCGAYVCAILEADGAVYATLNINVLDERAAFPAVDEPVSYDSEDAAQRVARRVAAWTPARLLVPDG
jgi:hypothetical protein